MKTKDSSSLMQRAEEILQRSLGEGLAELITARGLSGAAQHLEVTPGVLQYWMKKYGIETAYIALSPRDSLLIKRGDELGEELVEVG